MIKVPVRSLKDVGGERRLELGLGFIFWVTFLRKIPRKFFEKMLLYVTYRSSEAMQVGDKYRGRLLNQAINE